MPIQGQTIMKYDVFISYSRKDSAVVNRFVKEIVAAGYTIWMDVDGIETGDEFKKKIVSAIKGSQVFVFFSSKDSNVSPWTVKEVNVAVNLKKTIIPIKLDNAVYDDSILFDLAGLDYIQCNNDRDSVAISKLTGVLKRKIGSGSAPLPPVEDSKPLDSLEPQSAVSEKDAAIKGGFKLLFPTGALLRIISGIEKKTFGLLASVFKKRPDNRTKRPFNKRLFTIISIVVVCAVVAFFGIKSCYDHRTHGKHKGHEWVDLGLPSGVKWATCNVGATNPWEYGGYYAWGETEEKDCYDWSTYKWCKGSDDTMTKYCTSSSYGTVDNKTILEPQDDVAHVRWGGRWRMPTAEEQQELYDECTWERTELNGVYGYTITGPNGNSIFLPVAGYCDGMNIDHRNESYGDGCNWSSSLSRVSSRRANYMNNTGDSGKRCCGRSVRPVCD